MPREGTKTKFISQNAKRKCFIEIRYAPGGDENSSEARTEYARPRIEIRYAPGGDENRISQPKKNALRKILRLDMPREGTKTLQPFDLVVNPALRLDMPREGTKTMRNCHIH